MKENNKGFSLLELVVSMCILAIVGFILLGIIQSGTNSYTRTSKSINVQNEAQLAMDQIQEILIDATNGISTTDSVPAGDIFGALDDETIEKKDLEKLYAFNVEQDASGDDVNICMEIAWDKGSKEIYYSETVYRQEPLTKKWEPDVAETDARDIKNNLLAEHVEAFSADLTDIHANHTVTIALEFKVSGQEFKTQKQIKLRNTSWGLTLDSSPGPGVSSAPVLSAGP